MKIARKKSKKPLLIIAAIALIAALAASGYFVISQQNSQITNTPPTDTVDPVNYDPPTEQEKEEADKQKDEIVNPSPTPQAPDTTSSMSVIINRASANADDNLLYVRTTVNGTSSGECQVSLTKSGAKTVSKTFPVTVEATTVTCNGDLSLSSFSNGNWNLSIIVKKGDKVSKPATQMVTIKK